MTKYEMTFLLNEESELKQIKETIESFSGKILKENDLGKKILAYPIKKLTSARFYNFLIEIEKSKILELKIKLNFNEKLIRYLLLVYE